VIQGVQTMLRFPGMRDHGGGLAALPR
jgi:hypothetical protein